MSSLSGLRSVFDDLIRDRAETVVYGFSDIGALLPQDLALLPRAVTLALRMPEDLMDSIKDGPTDAYYAEYNRVNALIDELAGAFAGAIEERGYKVRRIPASGAYDRESLLAEFPHKTGAVQAGLGWIGRNCQLVTRAFGPRVRLGTLLTDMPAGEENRAVTRSYCGDCMACVTACPAKALTGKLWSPGLERGELFTARICADWKALHYPRFKGSVCGICTSVCPMGTKRKRRATQSKRNKSAFP